MWQEQRLGSTCTLVWQQELKIKHCEASQTCTLLCISLETRLLISKIHLTPFFIMSKFSLLSKLSLVSKCLFCVKGTRCYITGAINTKYTEGENTWRQCVSSSHKLDRKFISSVVCNNNFLCTTIIILKQLGSFKGVKHKSNQHHSDLERKKKCKYWAENNPLLGSQSWMDRLPGYLIYCDSNCFNRLGCTW